TAAGSSAGQVCRGPLWIPFGSGRGEGRRQLTTFPPTLMHKNRLAEPGKFVLKLRWRCMFPQIAAGVKGSPAVLPAASGARRQERAVSSKVASSHALTHPRRHPRQLAGARGYRGTV